VGNGRYEEGRLRARVAKVAIEVDGEFASKNVENEECSKSERRKKKINVSKRLF